MKTFAIADCQLPIEQQSQLTLRRAGALGRNRKQLEIGNCQLAM